MSEARSMGFKSDSTVCIIRNGRLEKMQKKLDLKVVAMRDKKTRQLFIYIPNQTETSGFSLIGYIP